jgi:hypothetical protein
MQRTGRYHIVNTLVTRIERCSANAAQSRQSVTIGLVTYLLRLTILFRFYI